PTHAVAGFKVQVEAGDGRRLPLPLVGEVGRDVRLEWRLVRRKARVAVDAVERSAHPARPRDDGRADAGEVRPGIGDELEHRSFPVGFEPRALFGEPLAVVVRLELAEKRDEVWREIPSHAGFEV